MESQTVLSKPRAHGISPFSFSKHVQYWKNKRPLYDPAVNISHKAWLTGRENNKNDEKHNSPLSL